MRRLLFVLALVGCSAAPKASSDYPVQEPQQSSAASDEPPPEDTEPLEPEDTEEPEEKKEKPKEKPAKEPTSYVGVTAANEPLPFGGGPGQCKFMLTMKDVSVSLSIKSTTVSADVKNTMVEELNGSCPSAALPPQLQEFSFSGEADPSAKMRLDMVGKSGNVPKTKLAMELTKKGDDYEATLVWLRDEDQERSLVWTTSATVICGPR